LTTLFFESPFFLQPHICACNMLVETFFFLSTSYSLSDFQLAPSTFPPTFFFYFSPEPATFLPAAPLHKSPPNLPFLDSKRNCSDFAVSSRVLFLYSPAHPYSLPRPSPQVPPPPDTPPLPFSSSRYIRESCRTR